MLSAIIRVEDPSTCSVEVIEDGLTEVAMDLESLSAPTAGAVESLRAEQIEEVVIANVLIHQIRDRKVHGFISSVRAGLSSSNQPWTPCESQDHPLPISLHEPPRGTPDNRVIHAFVMLYG